MPRRRCWRSVWACSASAPLIGCRFKKKDDPSKFEKYRLLILIVEIRERERKNKSPARTKCVRRIFFFFFNIFFLFVCVFLRPSGLVPRADGRAKHGGPAGVSSVLFRHTGHRRQDIRLVRRRQVLFCDVMCRAPSHRLLHEFEPGSARSCASARGRLIAASCGLAAVVSCFCALTLCVPVCVFRGVL